VPETVLKKEKGVRKKPVGFVWFRLASREVLKTWELYDSIQQISKSH
jgi:hypothetical protein